MEAYFDKNDCFDRLADIEMLSHILASDKKIIILYAGGWHCENILKFLQRNGFTCTRYIENNGNELNAGFLSALQQDCLARGMQSAAQSAFQLAQPVRKPVGRPVRNGLSAKRS